MSSKRSQLATIIECTKLAEHGQGRVVRRRERTTHKRALSPTQLQPHPPSSQATSSLHLVMPSILIFGAAATASNIGFHATLTLLSTSPSTTCVLFSRRPSSLKEDSRIVALPEEQKTRLQFIQGNAFSKEDVSRAFEQVTSEGDLEGIYFGIGEQEA